MDMGYGGTLAVVTGSTSGIGFATARMLLIEGARVVVNGRSRESVDKAVDRLGAGCVGVPGDLGTAEGAEAFAKGVLAVGEPDILINNAGIFAPGDFFETGDDVWEKFLQVNLMSAVRVTRALMPGMLERGFGRVVFVASESAVNVPTEMIHYGVTKTALLGLSRGLATLAAGKDVTVNAVLPGPTLSEGVKEHIDKLAEQEGKTAAQVKEDFFKDVRPTSLIGRFTSPEEIARMIVYAASPKSGATTGAALRVEGGIVMSIV